MQTVWNRTLINAITRSLLTVSLALFGVGRVWAQSLTFQIFDVPSPNAFAYAYPGQGINDAGEVVGAFQSDWPSCGDQNSGCYHGYLVSGGVISPIDVNGSISTAVFGINNSHQITGYYETSAPPLLIPRHGFVMTNGALSSFDFPGSTDTEPMAINNAGLVVGNYYAIHWHGFLLSGGSPTSIDYPNAEDTYATGINDAGDIVGYYADNSGWHGFILSHGQYTTIINGIVYTGGINNAGQVVGYNGSTSFIWSAGQLTPINCNQQISPTLTRVFAINNSGWLAGYCQINSSTFGHGFVATGPSLVDPIDPDPTKSLLNGSVVSTDANLLSAKGRSVQGVAADGTTEVVIRIPTVNPGDQFTLTIMNDQQPSSQSTSVPDDGALGIPGATSFTQHQITVTPQNTGQAISEAFAVYLAPIDFARPLGSGVYQRGNCGGTNLSDDLSGCRTVTIQIQNQTSGAMASIPIRILRPPVILIHGLWADPSSWSNFAPFNVAISSDGRFFSGAVGYDTPVSIASSNPSFDTSMYPKVLGNSMGFPYNAPEVAAQFDILLQNFKIGQNPQAVPVAAIQGDMVAHSMGGNITRSWALRTDFLSPSNFGQGSVHKVITIDTPHLGTPLATQLLSGQNNCVLSRFANFGKFSLISVVLSNGLTSAGAVWDLQGDGLGGGMSSDLADLANPLLAQHPLPTALIAAAADSANLSGVDGSVATNVVRNICLNNGDPLAVNLTSAAWPNVFSGGQPNDVIVPLNSELNRINGNPTTTVSPGSLFTSPGYIHTRGVAVFGFHGPSVLDSGAVPAQVVNLLNTPVTDPLFNLLNP